MRKRYKRRSLVIREGDTVRVVLGKDKGHKGKVIAVHSQKDKVMVEKLTVSKADGKKVARALKSNALVITRLNLADPWRRRRLGVGGKVEGEEEGGGEGEWEGEE